LQRESIPAWELSCSLAKAALALAWKAAAKAEADQINFANAMVETAFAKLQQRFVLYFINFTTCCLLGSSLAEKASAPSLCHTSAMTSIFYLSGMQRKLRRVV